MVEAVTNHDKSKMEPLDHSHENGDATMSDEQTRAQQLLLTQVCSQL